VSEPAYFSASCSTCNVGLTADARHTAEWVTAHVERRELAERLEGALSSGIDPSWARLEAGDHVVLVRRVRPRQMRGLKNLREGRIDGHPGQDLTR